MIDMQFLEYDDTLGRARSRHNGDADMLRVLPLALGVGLMIAWTDYAAAQAPLGLTVPLGFEVTEFADHTLANDIYCMTLDPKGRVVVSGRGYIKILVDDDKGGKANRAIDFAETPKDGAMGLLWEGDTLFVTGDGGLRQFTTQDGDHAAGPARLIRKMKTGSDHMAHAILRGPDGWLYVLCGNTSGIDQSFAQLPTSPIKQPVAGCVLRFTPDLTRSEVVADGFRNAYCMDFNSDGELFTWDSDNERCLSLPWYEGTRFYHVLPGGHYGWQAPQVAATWRQPPYFLDVVPPLLDMGRGSPTGVACYRQGQFPEKYRGGFFCCDWTFGKVWFLALERDGSSYRATKELFLASAGDNGFAPTACVVHPRTGDLYIAIGGRGTRGAVYRIRYPQGIKGVGAALQPLVQSLDWSPEQQSEWLTLAGGAHALKRRHALQMLLRHADKVDTNKRLQAVRINLDHPDRSIRRVTAELAKTLPDKVRASLLETKDASEWQTLTALFGNVEADPAKVLQQTQALWVTLFQRAREPGRDQALACARIMQLALGDLTSAKSAGTIWEGYSARLSVKDIEKRVGEQAIDAARKWLVVSFKNHQDPVVRREIARTLGMLGDCADRPFTDHRLARLLVLKHLWQRDDPVDEVHFLTALARIGGVADGLAKDMATTLLLLDAKLDGRHLPRERNWPLRIGELTAELVRQDSTLASALVQHRDFGWPDHVLFVEAAKIDRKTAAAAFLKKASGDPGYPWNAGVVELIGDLPAAQALPVLQRLWGKAGVDAAILPILARQPRQDDRGKFVEGLGAPQLATVRVCLQALQEYPAQKDLEETVALLRAAGNLPDNKEATALRAALFERLKATTGQNFGTDREAWLKWFAKAEPKLAAKLTNPDGVDVEAWAKRLAAVDWSRGEAGRGKGVFLKASCATCHGGTQAIGPDLHGVAGRFARDDLLTAIIQPSRDVADRYRTTVIETESGKVYQGVVILHTGSATTVRIAGKDIASRRISRISLMPAGLLDNLLDRDIADLYAYLKTLGPR
jgi:putative membrane-bound dehydrogenase-like protein